MATYTILNEMTNEICKKVKRIVKKCEKIIFRANSM